MNPTPKSLLYLSRGDLLRLGGGDSALYVSAIEEALTAHARGQYAQPLKPYLRWRGPQGHIADRIIAMPAYIGGEVPMAGLKWIGSKHDNPSRHGLERASALIVLNDAQTHYPIALMEGGLVSSMRTAAISAVASRLLAREGFRSVACIGGGPIAQTQLRTLLEQFPSLACIALYDVRPEAAARLVEALRPRFPRVDWRLGRSAEDAIRGAEVVVTCTTTAEPYIPFEWLSPGTFVSNISIMDVHKEVFLRADKVVVDDWEQCNREGKVIHQLVQEGRFSRERLHAELGEVLTGHKPGRQSEDEIILLNPMGMAVDDVACARALYLKALEAGVGTWLSLD